MIQLRRVTNQGDGGATRIKELPFDSFDDQRVHKQLEAGRLQFEQDAEWLSGHLPAMREKHSHWFQEYGGFWVAIHQGQEVASAIDFEDLLEEIHACGLRATNVLREYVTTEEVEHLHLRV